MNILILTTHLNPGGVSRYVLNLAKGLVRENHKVWVASSGGAWVKDLANIGAIHETIPIKTKSIASFKIWLSLFRLRKIISDQNIDVIHANTRVTQCLADLIYRKLKIPYISAFHGFYKPNLFRKLFKFSGVLAISVSNKVKRHLIQDLKIEEGKIRVVYNGIDIKAFAPGENRRKEKGFSPSDYLIGILGRISEEKGHFLALEAVKLLLPCYQNIQLLISGEGRLKDKLEREIETKQLSRNVKFYPTSSDEFLDTINLLIMPSIKEGFGYSVVEAFAKKVPVVGYSTGGISEIIRSRENGMLFYGYEPFALAAAIKELIIDRDLREKIVKQAYRDVFFFSIERMVPETLKVYQEVVK